MITWQEWKASRAAITSGSFAVATYDLGPRDGVPVTFLHGYPSSSLDIEPAWRALVREARLVTLDLPGFGASDKPRDHRYSIHAAADAVEALWDASDISNTVLVAHDYGVSVGQELLARLAEGVLAVDVQSTIWMNGGLYPDLHRPTVGQQMLLDPEHGSELAAAVTQSMFTEGIRATWGERVPMDDETIGHIWESMDDGDGVARMHELLHYVADRREHEHRWCTALEQTPVPASFVWGDLDPVSGAHMIERVEARIPHARVIRLADVGHWPPLEAPDVVAAALDDALSRA